MENVVIRNMKEEDSAEVLEMMKVFYASPALLSDPSEEVMKRDIEDCLGDNPFIECFVFEVAQVLSWVIQWLHTVILLNVVVIVCGLKIYILSRITEERV